MASAPVSNRRTVKGLAFKPCVFCGREHTDKHDKPFNYQYLNERTGEWDKFVSCSKTCRSAYRTINGE